jgi:hypothetical protein
MKALLATLILTPSILPLHAALVWDGGGGNLFFFTEANWHDTVTNANPVANSVNPATNINQDMFVTGITGLGGGSGVGGNVDLGPTGSLTLASSTMNMTLTPNAYGVRGSSAAPGSTDRPLTLFGTSALLTQFIADINATIRDDSVITFNGGADPVNSSTIDMIGYDKSPVVFLNETPSDVLTEHLSKMTFYGSPLVVGSDLAAFEPGDNVVILSNGGTGSIIQTIPEPSRALSAALGSLALLLRRRR